ncbi:MAG: hypothetical protein WAW37_20840 [Syntrophobacteraceae bacterium]
MKRLMLFVFVSAVLIMPCGLFAQQTNVTSTVTRTESVGTISEFSPDTIVIRSETSTSPNRYSYTEKTTYVDDTGAAVSRETVKSGLPVTVYYTRDGDRMIADKVVVRRTTTTGNSGIEEKRTSTKTTTETRY